VQHGGLAHAAAPKDSRDLNQRLNVVRRVKKGEAPRQYCEQDDAGGPDINLYKKKLQF
jgi:hypothetical protein